jgi:hypothetical protein
LFVLESSDLDGLVEESGVVTMFEQSTDGDVIDTLLDTIAQTSGSLVLGNVDNDVDHGTLIGDQDLGVVGTENFNVVTLLQDGTSVGEFSVGTFDGGESLTVQNNLVSGVNFDDINTVGNGGSDNTSPCVTRVHSVESGVNGEELVVGLGHHEVTFFVDIEVSTTLERKDVGIIENCARHEFDGLSGGGWESLASTTDVVSVAFEDNVETSSALQRSTNGNTGNALMASLDQSLV